MPFLDFKTSWFATIGGLLLAETSNLKRRRRVDNTILLSNMANRWPGWIKFKKLCRLVPLSYFNDRNILLPIQLRGPALKGTYAYGCRPRHSSGKNRSGLKTNGFGNIFGFRCIAKVKNPIVHPAGKKYFPEKYFPNRINWWNKLHDAHFLKFTNLNIV